MRAGGTSPPTPVSGSGGVRGATTSQAHGIAILCRTRRAGCVVPVVGVYVVQYYSCCRRIDFWVANLLLRGCPAHAGLAPPAMYYCTRSSMGDARSRSVPVDLAYVLFIDFLALRVLRFCFLLLSNVQFLVLVNLPPGLATRVVRWAPIGRSVGGKRMSQDSIQAESQPTAAAHIGMPPHATAVRNRSPAPAAAAAEHTGLGVGRAAASLATLMAIVTAAAWERLPEPYMDEIFHVKQTQSGKTISYYQALK